MSKLHNSLNHIVIGLSKSTDSSISGAISVLHDHIDVLSSETFLRKWSRVIDSLLVFFLSSGLGLTCRLLSEFLGFSL